MYNYTRDCIGAFLIFGRPTSHAIDKSHNSDDAQANQDDAANKYEVRRIICLFLIADKLRVH